MLNNYRDLKVWQKPYRPCLDLYGLTKKDAQSADKIVGEQTLDPLNPRTLFSN